MITFKSPQDLNKLNSNDPAYPVVKKLVAVLISAYTWEGHPYLPDDYGYVVLIEEKDVDRVLDEIWDDWTLLDIPWEGINHVTPDFFYAVFLANDEFGIGFVIPDEEWVNGKLREVIELHLDP